MVHLDLTNKCITVASRDSGGKVNTRRTSLAMEECDGAAVTLDFEEEITLPSQAQQAEVLVDVASDYGLGARSKPEVSTHLQQVDVAEVKAGAKAHQVPYAAGKGGVGEKAAAGRTGIVSDAALFGQGHLRFAGTALKCQELSAVNQAVLFRDGGL